MTKKITVLILALMILSLYTYGQNNSRNQGLYKVVYEADREGKTISGNLENLLSYVRAGNPIRVGWELGQSGPNRILLEHWTDAGFLTIHKGHLFAQINSIYAQGPSAPSVERPSVMMPNAEPNGWVSIIGTTGSMRAKFKIDQKMVNAFKEMGMSDSEIEKQMKDREKSKVKTKWAVMIKG